MSNMKKWNNVIAVIVALLGVAVIALSSKFPIELGEGDPGAGFWPTVLGAILIFLAVLLFITNIVRGKTEKEKTFALTLPGNKLVYVFMGLTVGFCVVMYFLGLLVAALLFIPVAMYLLGARGKMIFIIDIVFVALLYLVFVQLLHTPLPEPIWLR
jgi:hypothetical protein